jgi:hypothetical protein
LIDTFVLQGPVPGRHGKPMNPQIKSQAPQNSNWVLWLGEARADALVRRYPDRSIASLAFLNQELIGQFLSEMGLVEVAMRNLISSGLTNRLQRRGIQEHWTLDPTGELSAVRGGDLVAKILAARRQVSLLKPAYGPDDVVAELPLGFWNTILGRSAAAFNVDLVGQFQGLDSRSLKHLSQRVHSFRLLRNRMAHQHLVLHLDLDWHHKNNLQLAKDLSPQLADSLAIHSKVESTLVEWRKLS